MMSDQQPSVKKTICKPPTLQSLKMAIAEGLESGPSELLDIEAIKAEARRALLDARR